jgi:hypothetical protein
VEIGLPQLVFLIIFSQVIFNHHLQLFFFASVGNHSKHNINDWQYIPHLIHGERHVFGRFAVIFSVAIVWIYAHLLTVGGAYKNTGPRTQLSCRTDHSGIIGAAPW